MKKYLMTAFVGVSLLMVAGCKKEVTVTTNALVDAYLETFTEGLDADKKGKRGPFLTDGKELVFIPRAELAQLELTSGSLTYKAGKKQKKYRMMPSAVASVELLKEFLGEK